MEKNVDASKIVEELLRDSLSCVRYEGASNELNGIDVKEIKEELELTYKKVIANESKVYVLSNGQKRSISNSLVMNHPESLLNVNLIDIDSRTSNHEIEIDFQLKFYDEILKYMNNDYNINELNGVEFDRFCHELMEMNIPFKMDIVNRLITDSNKYGVGWKNHYLIVNGNECNLALKHLKMKLHNLKYNNSNECIECMIDNKYESILQAFSKFIENENIKYNKLVANLDRRTVNMFVNEYIIDTNNDIVKQFFNPIYAPFLKNTILFGNEYDSKLREWAGDYKWKLLYRASEHDYTAKSFHEYCDDKGPTLVIIKSSGGWIFGGYTTQSWSGDSIYYV